MSEELTTFEREVDEEVRQDQMVRLWKAYGPWIMGGVGGALAITLVTMGISSWRQSAVESASNEFQAALDNSATAAAGVSAGTFEALRNSAGGYGLLARFQEAEAWVNAGDTAKAIETYDAIAGESGVANRYRSLARLKAAYLVVDTAEPDAVMTRLRPLLDPGNPWRAFAQELKGTVHLRAEDFASAKTEFDALAGDSDAPQGLRSRAQRMSEFLAGAVTAPQPAGDEGQTSGGAAPAGDTGGDDTQGSTP